MGGFQHGYTYAGNPLACAAGLAVLNEIETGLGLRWRTPPAMGALPQVRARRAGRRYPFIADVRGKGLLIGADMVADRVTLQPLPKA
jgi:4-aminobutyrate aminotransferase-like enzyme